LEELKISRNRLESKGAIAISKVLSKMTSLKVIHIMQNGIKDDGMTELVKSFGLNPYLEEIKMNDNILKASCLVFVDNLKKLSNLRIIDLSDLVIKDENSIKLFKEFKNLKLLEQVYFNYNEIERKSTQKTIFEICSEMKLKHFEIKGNEINGKVWKEYKDRILNKFENVKIYSDEEEVDGEESNEEEEEEEEEKEIVKVNEDMKKLDINKK